MTAIYRAIIHSLPNIFWRILRFFEKMGFFGVFGGAMGGHFGSPQGDDGTEWKIIRSKA